MDLLSLQDLEATGAHAKIERLLAANLRASTDPQLWKYASTYYVRRGMAGKSLEYYSGYLQTTTAGTRDSEAIALAIECAHRLARHALVREYFTALTNEERETLPTKTLTQVATALVALGFINEGEIIVRFLRNRTGMGQLPGFSQVITEKFGNTKGALAYIARTPEIVPESDSNEQIKHAMSLALAHIAHGNFRQAERILVDCKSRVAA